jgi:hypothetical protein
MRQYEGRPHEYDTLYPKLCEEWRVRILYGELEDEWIAHIQDCDLFDLSDEELDDAFHEWAWREACKRAHNELT